MALMDESVVVMKQKGDVSSTEEADVVLSQLLTQGCWANSFVSSQKLTVNMDTCAMQGTMWCPLWQLVGCYDSNPVLYAINCVKKKKHIFRIFHLWKHNPLTRFNTVNNIMCCAIVLLNIWICTANSQICWNV